MNFERVCLRGFICTFAENEGLGILSCKTGLKCSKNDDYSREGAQYQTKWRFFV
jgi:hypothetical protein